MSYALYTVMKPLTVNQALNKGYATKADALESAQRVTWTLGTDCEVYYDDKRQIHKWRIKLVIVSEP
jgi:DhnA family fructose-bisphosphate aldolase class Ia